MPDPRMSAPEIRAQFSRAEARISDLDEALREATMWMKQQMETNEVLSNRITELEECIADMESQ